MARRRKQRALQPARDPGKSLPYEMGELPGDRGPTRGKPYDANAAIAFMRRHRARAERKAATMPKKGRSR